MTSSASDTEPEIVRLRAAVAIAEIQQLAFQYAVAVDTRDIDLLESLWVPTSERVEWPLMNLQTVREGWQSWFRKGMTIHHVTNHAVDVRSSTSATGIVYCIAQLDLRTHFVDRSLMYEDRYASVEGRWRFETRKHLLWFGRKWSDNPADQPPAAWPHGYGTGTLPGAVMPPERQHWLLP